MAIFTPRGLKIRLPFDYAFALIARLYPKVDAFEVLKTTEGLKLIPSLITFITGFVCFYLRLPVFEIGLYVFIASIAGFLMTFFGLFIIPGIVFDEDGNKKPLLLPEKFTALFRYQKEADRKKSEIVNTLRDYTADRKGELLASGIEKEIFQNWHVANIGRFRKIAMMCDVPDIKEIIFHDLERYDRIRFRKKNSMQKLIRYREWFYYNMAHELCRKYHTIVTEDVSIKKMLMPRVIDEKEGRDTRTVQRYSRLVAPGEWRAILKDVASKYGTKIVEVEAAYTTLLCSRCGQFFNNNDSERQKLILTCPHCGNKIDQDENAARNLLDSYFRKPIGDFLKKRVCEKNIG